MAMRELLTAALCLSILLCACVQKPVDTQPTKSEEAVSQNQSAKPQEETSLTTKQQEQPTAAEKEDLQQEMIATEPKSKQEWWQQALSKEALLPSTDETAGCGEQRTGMSTCCVYSNTQRQSAFALGAFGKSGVNTDFSFILNTAKVSEDIGKPLTEPSFFEILMLDDTKYTGTFYEKGIAFAKAEPGKDAGQPVLLAIEQEDYKALIASMNTVFAERNQHGAWSSWLTLMRESKGSSIKVTSSDGKSETEYMNEKSSWQFSELFSNIQRIYVKPGSCKNVDKSTVLNEATKVQIKFSNGITYDIQLNEANLVIASSDMPQALQYDAWVDQRERFNEIAKNRLNPSTGKPVIYLYPEKTTDVTVKLGFNGTVTYTYPSYNSGWNVTASPDGHLVNKADGSEHFYLFWEGDTNLDWNFDQGFVVKGEDTEEFLRQSLKTIGLTPREYNDFLVYWVPQMQDNPYNMITFADKQYEQLAPLTITPKPDSILRVHMVFKPLERPVEISKQELKPFERQGFTVVEWGGTRAK